jgi:Phosphatidylethanolamine-binding protein
MKNMATLALLFAFMPVGAQSNLQVEFRWTIAHHCNPTSPIIKVKNIPPGTTALEVTMTNLDSKNPVHGTGGGTLTQAEGFPADFVIPAGALTHYIGPCPDNFTTLGHEYEFKVNALNPDKQVLAKGAHKAPFSGKFVILQGVIGSP